MEQNDDRLVKKQEQFCRNRMGSYKKSQSLSIPLPIYPISFVGSNAFCAAVVVVVVVVVV